MWGWGQREGDRVDPGAAAVGHLPMAERTQNRGRCPQEAVSPGSEPLSRFADPCCVRVLHPVEKRRHGRDMGNSQLKLLVQLQPLRKSFFQSTRHLWPTSHGLPTAVCEPISPFKGISEATVLLSKRHDELRGLVMFDEALFSQAWSLNAWPIFIFQLSF